MHTLSKPLVGLRNQKPTLQGTHPLPPLGTPRLILASTPPPPRLYLALHPLRCQRHGVSSRLYKRGGVTESMRGGGICRRVCGRVSGHLVLVVVVVMV